MQAPVSLPLGKVVPYFVVERDGGTFMRAAQDSVIQAALPRILEERSAHRDWGDLGPILVTGSAGFLGRSMVLALRGLGATAIGLDVAAGPETDELCSVQDGAAVAAVVARHGCKAIIHAAALHAPNLDYFDSETFRSVNVGGTANVLAAARNHNVHTVLFCSTTSLMVTATVKLAEKQLEPGAPPVVLSPENPNETPRNIYGKTKLEAEGLCLDLAQAGGGPNVAVLRCSRFFAEDIFVSDEPASSRTGSTSSGNAKALELLGGVRASLLDVCLVHLDVLAALSDAPRGTRIVGPWIIAAPSPLLNWEFWQGPAGCALRARAEAAFAAAGWPPLGTTRRVYDSSKTWAWLGHGPCLGFAELLAGLEAGQEWALNGMY